MIKNISKIKNKKVCFSFIRESTVSEIADLMDLEDIGAVPILDHQHILIGIVSERDIVRRLVKTGRDSDLVTANDIMTKEVKTISINTSIAEAQKIMTENNVRHLPVVNENNKLINFLSQRDLIIESPKKIIKIMTIGFLLLFLIVIFIIN